jgi:hypothetical protein
MRPTLCGLSAILAVMMAGERVQARDLAGIPWPEYVSRSELVFHGALVKAEFVDLEKPSDIRCTYRIYDVYKGEELKEVTFIASREENINREVGGIAIVALRKQRGQWVLSVDERSCWTYANEMKKDFGGLGVYQVPEVLLYGMPSDLSETVEILVRYGDAYKPELKKRFTAAKVEKNLKLALAATQPAGK